MPTLCRDCRNPPRIQVTPDHVDWWLTNFPRREVVTLAKIIFGDGGQDPTALLASMTQTKENP